MNELESSFITKKQYSIGIDLHQIDVIKLCKLCCYKDLCKNDNCTCYFHNLQQFISMQTREDTTTISPDNKTPPGIVQLAILITAVVWIFIFAVILYRICAKYRNLSSRFTSLITATTTRPRRSNNDSIDIQVAQSLRDRPPSYRQSNRHMMPEDAPPIYDDVFKSQRGSVIKDQKLPSYEMAIGINPYSGTTLEIDVLNHANESNEERNNSQLSNNQQAAVLHI